MTQLGAQGVTVELPPGFEGRATRRPVAPDAQASAQSVGATTPAVPDRFNVVLHAATVPLPPEVGDFGSNAVDLLGPDDVFVSMFEYGPEAANTPLFAEKGIPRSLAREAFNPKVLQRSIPGQSGAQRFFTEGGRAFCLYVVLGSDARKPALVNKLNSMLATLHIETLVTDPQLRHGTPEPLTPTTTVPIGTVVDLIRAQADLRTLTDLLATSGIDTTLENDGPFTVFAPSDTAFATEDLDALRADATKLRRVIEFHAAEGELHVDARHVDPLRAGQELTTLAGPRVTIGRKGVAYTVDSATLIRPDLGANNGVVHVIDRVLEPPQ